MIQVCEPPRTRQARRLSAEEFCQLIRSEVSCVYRPRSEVLRMLTVGEVWGVCGARRVPDAACILLPMDADTAAAAALRSFVGGRNAADGYFLAPPVGRTEAFQALLEAAAARQKALARHRPRWAVAECTAEELLPLYLQQGFAHPSVGQPCALLLAAGGLSGAKRAAGVGADDRPGASGHSAGKGLCCAGKPRKPAGYRAGAVPGLTGK